MTEQTSYRVLARQYRPRHFADVIGQEAAVSALTYALKNNKLAHAYMFSGTRGVGKTTLARLLARAVNCLAFDDFLATKTEIYPCGVCENCTAIENDAFIDVLEMDAASHTGVDDVRQIIDTVRYRPTVGRYKVYIIDEVHMLSKNAFNALLKTLEEPPANTLFLFATTELKRVPITILSRCQRFDVRNISVEEVASHLKNVATKENIAIEENALALIAKVASGSMRDALSLLDRVQLLAGDKPVDETVLKDILGFADEAALNALIDHLTKNDVKALIKNLDDFYENGIEPLNLLHDVLERIYALMLHSVYEDEISYTKAQLMRLWQLLSAGVADIASAFSPLMSLKMLMMRAAYVHQLPTPDEVMKHLDGAVENETVSLKNFEDVVKFFEAKREMILAKHLREDVAALSFAHGKIVLTLLKKVPVTFVKNVGEALKNATGVNWTIELSEGQAEALVIKEQKAEEAFLEDIKKNPLVDEALAMFEGAEVGKIVKK